MRAGPNLHKVRVCSRADERRRYFLQGGFSDRVNWKQVATVHRNGDPPSQDVKKHSDSSCTIELIEHRELLRKRTSHQADRVTYL